MKTAVLLRGLSRNYLHTYKNLLKNVGDCDFFIFTWDTDGKRTGKDDRYSYSRAPITMDRIVNAYKPIAYEVESFKEFLDKNKEKIYENGKRMDLNMAIEKISNALIHSISSQMYGFQQVVRLFLDNADLALYDRVVITRFDYNITSKLPSPCQGIVYANKSWKPTYYQSDITAKVWRLPSFQDYACIIHIDDVREFVSIYDTLYATHVSNLLGQWGIPLDYREARSKMIYPPLAEMWLYHFVASRKLYMKSGEVEGKIVR